MRSNIKHTLLILAVLFCAAYAATAAYAHQIPDAHGNYVNDFAGVLSPADKSRLEALSREVRDVNSTEFVIVTVPWVTEGDEDFFKACTDYFNEQRIGKKGANNGVLLVLATEERKCFIIPGKGMEGALPDSLCKEIVDNEGKPYWKKGQENWGAGVIAIVEEANQYIKGEKFPSSSGSSTSGCGTAVGCVIAFWVACVGFIMWVGYLARVKCPVCKGKVKLLKTTEVLAPTTNRSGLEKREYECTVCKHKFVRSVTLPAKGKKSSDGGFWGGWSSGSSGGWSSSGGGGGSSGGGSFGGGCSGGGGGGSSF